MSDAQRAHLMLDAWVFVAIADPLEEPISPLANMIASADTYNRDVPSAREFEHAVRDLSRAGLVLVEGLSLNLTAVGREIWKTMRGCEHLMDRLLKSAEEMLRDIQCVAAEPGWSLDDRRDV
jgi:hypothetical protein